jgi:hypothetical protein
MFYIQFTCSILRVQSEMTTQLAKHNILVNTLPLHENTELIVNMWVTVTELKTKNMSHSGGINVHV